MPVVEVVEEVYDEPIEPELPPALSEVEYWWDAPAAANGTNGDGSPRRRPNNRLVAGARNSELVVMPRNNSRRNGRPTEAWPSRPRRHRFGQPGFCQQLRGRSQRSSTTVHDARFQRSLGGASSTAIAQSRSHRTAGGSSRDIRRHFTSRVSIDGLYSGIGMSLSQVSASDYRIVVRASKAERIREV